MIKMRMKNFKKYQEQFVFIKKNFPEELEIFLLDLAKSVMRITKRMTPVDDGELKGNWEISSVRKEGDALYVSILNETKTTYEGREVPLGPFVEFGHRIEGSDKRVKGFYMLTTSIKRVNKQIPRRLKKMFDDLISRS